MIRPIERTDVGAWAKLRREALDAHPLAFGASDPGDLAALEAIALARLAQEESVIFGAFEGTRLDRSICP